MSIDIGLGIALSYYHCKTLRNTKTGNKTIMIVGAVCVEVVPFAIRYIVSRFSCWQRRDGREESMKSEERLLGISRGNWVVDGGLWSNGTHI
jgi:hypothetical protein